MARWSEALDAQTALIRAYRTSEYQEYLRYWETVSEETLPGMSHEALEIAHNLLDGAEPIYVSADVTRLVDFAASTMKPEVLLESDYFVRSGFAYFESSISTEGTVRALQWTVRSDVAVIVGYEEGGRIAGSDLRIAFCYACRPGETLEEFGEGWRTLQAFWRLAQQQIVVPTIEVPKRAARRRALPRVVETVVVFTLRRVKRESGGARDVDWSHSWFVSGHWRNQWYPSLNAHRQIWIGTYVKQRDLPFIPKTHVTEFVR